MRYFLTLPGPVLELVEVKMRPEIHAWLLFRWRTEKIPRKDHSFKRLNQYSTSIQPVDWEECYELLTACHTHLTAVSTPVAPGRRCSCVQDVADAADRGPFSPWKLLKCCWISWLQSYVLKDSSNSSWGISPLKDTCLSRSKATQQNEQVTFDWASRVPEVQLRL